MSAYSNLRRLGGLGIACLIALSITSSASAVTVYSYTGANFNAFTDETPPAGSYTNAMHVSGNFTVAAPFAANLNGSLLPTSIFLDLSFTDGRQTINFANFDPNTFASFIAVNTDASGTVTGFQFGFASVLPTVLDGLFGQIRGSSTASGAVFDQCLTVSNGACIAPFGVDTAQGPGGNLILTSTDGTQTPLPTALPLFATGLSALGLLGWRRKPKAQAVA